METPFKKRGEIRRVWRNRVPYNRGNSYKDTGGHKVGTVGFNIQKKRWGATVRKQSERYKQD